MRRWWIPVALVALGALVFMREYPALKRYLNIEKM
jgi:hypothetical protein